MATPPLTKIRIELDYDGDDDAGAAKLSAADHALLKPPDMGDASSAYESDSTEFQLQKPAPKEVQLVRASRAGDSIRVAKLLAKNPKIDVNSTDTLGRSALRIAVKNDHLEVVEELIKRANTAKVCEALLLSIALGHDQISEAIIRNKAYRRCQMMMKTSTLKNGPRVVESALGQTMDDSLFSSDITPMILAAQKNQYDIVKLLISMGDKIREPCPEDCRCAQCLVSRRDELRHATTTLHTFKALASEAYISLQSQDPILASFELARKLRERSLHEGYFKSQYLVLADGLSDYAVKLLDKVRTGQELSDLLDDEEGRLTRLLLAIKYEEKKFVVHPSCQKKLLTVWLGDMPMQQHVNRIWQLALFSVLLTIAYPFLAISYWVYPWTKVGSFLKVPMVRCTASACSYIIFICGSVAYSVMERPALLTESGNETRLFDLQLHNEENSTLTISDYHKLYTDYSCFANTTPIHNFYVRNGRIGYGTYILLIWLAGLIYQSCKRIYHDGIATFLQSWYHVSDTFMYIFFLIAIAVRFVGSAKASDALEFFLQESAWRKLLKTECDHDHSIRASNALTRDVYFVNADRRQWDSADPYFLFEAMYAIGLVLAVCRLSYIFAIHPRIGPLMKSLSSMVKDIFVFMFIFALAIFGFFAGFNTLYWYHSPDQRSTDSDGEDYGITKLETVEIIFWAIFGMMDLEDVKFLQGERIYSDVTRITGVVLFALYNWIIVIVLITMLIAMMARSYEKVASAEDLEWKFSKSKLYMDHIRHGPTLCVPFNLVPTWKSIFYAFRFLWMKISPKCGRFELPVKRATPALGELRSDSTNPTCDSPEPITAENRNIFQLKSSINEKFNVKSPYEFTMRCIVDRFVAQSTNKTDKPDDTSKTDDSESLTREISSFRNEVNSALKWHEERATLMEARLCNIDTSLSTFLGKSEPVSSPGKHPARRLSPFAEEETKPRAKRLQRQNSFDLACVAASVAEMKQLMSEFRKEAVEELQEALRAMAEKDSSSKHRQKSLDVGKDCDDESQA